MIPLKISLRTGLSKYVCVPVLNPKAKSSVSKRVLKLMRNSDLCSFSPLMKKVLIQNVEIWCVLVETSGAKSVGIILSTTPALLRLMSKYNPRLKSLLESEECASCVKFFSDIDFMPLLESFENIVIVLYSGAKTICTFCLSQDAMNLAQSALKDAGKILCDGSMKIYRFVCDDLPRILQFILKHNVVLARFFSRNLPVAVSAIYKGLVLSGLIVCRILKAITKASKKFIKLLCDSFQEFASDYDLVDIIETAYSAIKKYVKIVCASDIYQRFKILIENCLEYTVKNMKIYLPIMCLEYIKFLQFIVSKSKKVISFVKQYLLNDVLTERNVNTIISTCTDIVRYLNVILLNAKMHAGELYKYSIEIFPEVVDCIRLILPVLWKWFYNFIKYSAKRVASFVRRTKYMLMKIKNSEFVLLCFHSYCCLMSNLLESMKSVCKFAICQCHRLASAGYNIMSSSEVKDLSVFVAKMEVLVASLSAEIYVSSRCALGVVSAAFLSGVRRVTPSLYKACAVIAPDVVCASSELASCAWNSSATVFPDMWEFATVIEPDVTRALNVVFKSSYDACVELTAFSATVVFHGSVVFRSLIVNLPTVARAVNEVTSKTFSASLEMSRAGRKAKTVVLRDLKGAVHVVRTSVFTAEDEVVIAFNEFVIDVEALLNANPHALEKLSMIKHAAAGDVNTKLWGDTFASVASVLDNLLKRVIAVINNNVLPLMALNVDEIKFIYSLESWLLMNLKHALPVVYQIITSLYSEVVSEVYPAVTLAWDSFKAITEMNWKMVCRGSSEGWSLIELVLPKIYEEFCLCTSTYWPIVKNASSASWDNIRYVSPILWNGIVATTPIVWQYSGDVLHQTWTFHVNSLGKVWEVVVPLSTETWALAVNILPGLWESACESSKMTWESFCSNTETSWGVVTKGSAAYWGFLEELISNSWSIGVKPAAKFTCYNSVYLFVRSIEVSHSICTKAKDTAGGLYDQVVGPILPPSTEDEDSNVRNRLPMNFQDILKPNSMPFKISLKSRWLHSAKALMTSFSDNIFKRYSCRLDSVPFAHLFTVKKMPFISINEKYNLGEQLFKGLVSFNIDDYYFGGYNTCLFH